jgi:hypothetical protein
MTNGASFRFSTLALVLGLWSASPLTAQPVGHVSGKNAARGMPKEGFVKGPRAEGVKVIESVLSDSASKNSRSFTQSSKRFLQGASPNPSGDELIGLMCYQNGSDSQLKTIVSSNSPFRNKDDVAVAQALTGLIERSDLAPGALLFRGRGQIPSSQKRKKPGDIIEEDSFMSTSTDPYVAKVFSDSAYNSDHVMDVIQVDSSGLKGLDVTASKHKPVSAPPSQATKSWHSKPCAHQQVDILDTESEVLLPPGARFRVLKLDQKMMNGVLWTIRYLEYVR